MSPLGRRSLIALLVAGALLRLAVLPLPGMEDVPGRKMRAFGASQDVTGAYGVGGNPIEHRMLRWNGEVGPVDHPPLAVYELALIGWLYRAIDPRFRDSLALTLLMKSIGVLFEALFVALLLTRGRRWLGSSAAQWAALAFWLSPAIWLIGPGLGYIDAQATVPAALALIAVGARRPGLAGVLAAVSVLTKPQAVFIMPVFVILVLRPAGRFDWRALGRMAASGLAVAGMVVLPFVLRGAWWNMLNDLSRIFHHDTVSSQAPNLGWIFSWVLRVALGVPDFGWKGALAIKNRILGIDRVVELGYPNPRTIGLVLTSAALAWAAWRAWRGVSRAQGAMLAAWAVYAYSTLGSQVHENHFTLAVPLLALAAAELRPLRSYFWAISAICTLNIYLFYGLGHGWPPLIDRGWTWIDLTVLLSVANVIVFVFFTRRVAVLTRADTPSL